MTVAQLIERLTAKGGASDKVVIEFALAPGLPAFPCEVRTDPIRGPGHVRIIVSAKARPVNAEELVRIQQEPKPLEIH